MRVENLPRFTADFETVTWLPNETYVWAWAICNIETNEIRTGNNITDFFVACQWYHNPIMYFHNLRFDGEFILHYLNEHGFKCLKPHEEKRNRTYKTIINELGLWYKIEVYFKVGNKQVNKVTFLDSLKIIPFSVEKIANEYNIEEKKLTLDYKKEREKGHKLTPQEEEYIKHDVLIVAKALKLTFDLGLKKNTLAANALENFTETIGRDLFEYLFVHLPVGVDKDIRQSYKGGWNYLNPIYKGKELGRGNAIDCNSLYPYVMKKYPIPYGYPIFFEGQYKYDHNYPLYVQQITCKFELKKGYLPTLARKGIGLYANNEYLTSSNGDFKTLTLTSVDLELFLKHYDIIGKINYEGGWKFKSISNVFNNYIDQWAAIKIEATKVGNKVLRTTAKLMLNALYGKMATSLEEKSKKPVVKNNVMHYEMNEVGEKKGVYLPAGTFITAYARRETIQVAQKIRDYSLNKYGKDLFYYSDTDSCHCGLSKKELAEIIKIDPVELGAWKIETEFKKAKFIKQKCYIEQLKDNNINIVCAGMPKDCWQYVEWQTFKVGFTCKGKLAYKHVKGGVILEDTNFTIRDENLQKDIAKF